MLSQTLTYGYDDFNRLTALTVNSGSVKNFGYSYDRYGNRVGQTAPNGGNTFSATVNPANNQFTNSGYVYDAAGNMTNDGFHTYTYDAEGNIQQVDSGSTAKYVYDAMNRRVRTQTASATLEYLFDAAGRRTSTWNTGNAGIEGRIYWDGKQIAYRAYDGNTYFEHQDWLGTERMRTTYTGTVAASFSSLPWGDGYTALNITGQGGQDSLNFATLDYDSEDSTSHAQYRNYSPKQGRWLRPDPYSGSYDFSNPQTLNRYAYSLNNPLSLIDPTGLECYDVDGDPIEFTDPGDEQGQCEELGGTWIDNPTTTVSVNGDDGGTSCSGFCDNGNENTGNNNDQNQNSGTTVAQCLGVALTKNGVSLALDAASIGVGFLPGGNTAVGAVKLFATVGIGAASAGYSAATSTSFGTGAAKFAINSGGTLFSAVGVLDKATSGLQAVSWVPVVGNIATYLSTAGDLIQTYQAYSSCRKGQ